MSFILDALKKSEAERQRQAGPTLLEIRVAPPAHRLPAWILGLGALLLINLGVLVWFVLRRPEPAPVGAQVPASPAAAVAPVTITTPVATATPAPAPVAAVPAPASAPAAATSATSAVVPTAAPTAVPARARAASDAEYSGNPADNEPAVAGPPAPPDNGGSYGGNSAGAIPAGGSVRVASSSSELPSATDLAGTIPLLRLDLHVYSDRPANRYALINMHKAREGDVLPDGERVLKITPDGVVLDYRGQEFILRKQ